LKNKILISFVVNVLIGILFCFPVFNINKYNSQAGDDINNTVISSNQTSFADISVIVGTSPQFFSGDNFYRIIESKIYQNDFDKGNNFNSGLFSSDIQSIIQDQFHIFSSTLIRKNPLTDVSYLKELRNTKMLC